MLKAGKNGYCDSTNSNTDTFRTTESSSQDPESIRNRIKNMTTGTAEEVSDRSRKSKLSLDNYSVIKNTNNMIQITDLEHQNSINHSFPDLKDHHSQPKDGSVFKSRNSMIFGSGYGENPESFREEISIQGLEGHNTLNTIMESETNYEERNPSTVVEKLELRETIQYDT